MLKFQSRALILTVSMLATLSGCSQESDPIQSPITITTTWLAGTDTSCEFVGAVHQKLVTGVNATTEDIRDFLPMDINVTSPVTGQEYQMSCTNESVKVSACRSNTNASVYFY